VKITYDPEADAVYIYLCREVRQPETREVDEDIYLDFDQENRLVGIEVLDASHRLDLGALLPVVTEA